MRGGREALGEQSGLIFIPEMSNLALELKKNYLAFLPYIMQKG